MSTTTVLRDEKIMFKCSPEIKRKLITHCETLGVSMSAFLAVLIGQTLRQADMAEGAMNQAIKSTMQEGINQYGKMMVSPQCPKCKGAESAASVEPDGKGGWKCHECLTPFH